MEDEDEENDDDDDFFCLAHFWGNIQSYLSVTLHYNSWLNNCYCQLPLLSASFSTLAR